MKAELWLTGKTSYDFIQEGMGVYEKRLKRYFPFEIVEVPHPKGQTDPERLKTLESEHWLRRLQPDDWLILLDERGQMHTSEGFARRMELLLNTSPRRIVFLIGGAYGFSPELYRRANEQLSLSKMTISHQLIRLFFLEQLYRAMSILKNEPYHHA